MRGMPLRAITLRLVSGWPATRSPKGAGWRVERDSSFPLNSRKRWHFATSMLHSLLRSLVAAPVLSLTTPAVASLDGRFESSPLHHRPSRIGQKVSVSGVSPKVLLDSQRRGSSSAGTFEGCDRRCRARVPIIATALAVLACDSPSCSTSAVDNASEGAPAP